jgi:hypothetical protein
MGVYQLVSGDGRSVSFDLDRDRRLVNVDCDVSGGEEVRFAGPLPDHIDAVESSSRALEYGIERGWRVCSYDPNRCQTCYCDDDGDLHCVGIC